MMNTSAFLSIAAGALAVFSGVVWMLQGFNSPWAPQSFMTGSFIWVFIGLVTLIGGYLLIRHGWRTRR